MKAVTGQVFDSEKAVAEGYSRYFLKGRIYSGLTPLYGQRTSGRLYLDVSKQALELLDEFEDKI
jgi:hypothetical protein